MAFQHDIPLAGRLGQLVNNEFTADVFFEVGSNHQPMYGHRNILSVGSPVFNAQLNGDFVDAKRNSSLNPIVVTDVEEDVFLQILKFIYCENAVVNQQNVVDLYYASQKYLLGNLSKICEEFIHFRLCSINVVTIFNANRKHEFKKVNDACLGTICDNPLAVLTGTNLTSLQRTSLEMIVSSLKINCTENQLLDAVSDWGKAFPNENTTPLRLMILNHKHRSLRCHKLHGFDSVCTASSPEIYLKIKTFRKIAIYGIGVYVGGSGLQRYRAEVKLSAEVIRKNFYQFSSILSKNENPSYYGTTKVTVQEEVYVQDIMFQKLIVGSGQECIISGKIALIKSASNAMFSLNQFKPYDLPQGVKISGRDSFSGDENNCVAYIMYNLV